MGTRFLLDTNSVIYYLDNALPNSAMNFLDTVLDIEAYVSVISKIELLGWNPPTGISLQPIQDFVDTATVLPLNDAVVQKTIEIRRSKKIKLPDAIIAATALVNGLEIVSRNVSDFSGITGLICYDPFTDL
jgi:predicted nucleic acid-binding protein